VYFWSDSQEIFFIPKHIYYLIYSKTNLISSGISEIIKNKIIIFAINYYSFSKENSLESIPDFQYNLNDI
ncbi:hypothetical protein, partial [Oceanobacillus oncorhynchi]